MMRRRRLACAAALLLLLLPGAARAAETIHQYDVRMAVAADGTLTVTETIDVTAEGNAIKRGLRRNLPLKRRMTLGGILPSDYEILSVTRDGADEPFKTWESPIDLDLRIGDAEKMLPPGRYRYEITYTVPGQVGFFRKYDELYWNAIGTEWTLPIERATATIVAPPGADILRHAAYTGKIMSAAADFTARQEPGQVHFTAGPFAPYEGMTVAAAWPKGFITPAPGPVAYALGQHPGLLLMLAGMAATFAYYAWAWRRHGRDPRQRSLTPFFTAPAGISPAVAASIQRLGAAKPHRLLAAAVISLAAKGHITIEEEPKGAFTLVATGTGRQSASTDERVILDALSGRLSLTRHNARWQNIAAAHERTLYKLCNGLYFKNNTGMWLWGWLPLFAMIAAQRWTLPDTVSHMVFLSLLLIAIGEFVRVMIVDKWRGHTKLRHALAALLLLPGFIFMYGTLLLRTDESLLLALPLSLAALAICMTRHAMKTLTPRGTAIVEQVNGLQYYMTMVEEKVLKTFDPPQMSRQLYEEFLPYAVALGVESKWGEKFTAGMAAATAAAATGGAAPVTAAALRPSWYRGSAAAAGAAGAFSAAMLLTNFNRALSAATASGGGSGSGGGGGRSSGGSSGGGRVGGGGGGGGGGGW